MTKTVRRLITLSMLPVLLLVSACGRRCQQKADAPFRSVVETPWRMVDTSDPQARKALDNFNFLIYNFSRDNTGTIDRVSDNSEDGTVMTIEWVPDPQQKLIRIKFSSVDSSFDSIDDVGFSSTGDQGTYDYAYELGREFKLYERKRGYWYRFVPFMGIVDPDNLCTF